MSQVRKAEAKSRVFESYELGTRAPAHASSNEINKFIRGEEKLEGKVSGIDTLYKRINCCDDCFFLPQKSTFQRSFEFPILHCSYPFELSSDLS